AQTTTKYVELIIVADNREVKEKYFCMCLCPFIYTVYGFSSLRSFFLQFYRALNIRVALVGLEVWSDLDKCPITQDPFTTLHEFLDWRKVKLLPTKPHDNAQLVRYKHGIVMDHSDNPLGAAVTLAHELGHNFGMNHDTPERGCGCRVTADRGGCIMTPSTGFYFSDTDGPFMPLIG
uniref:Peptidase M12B domain-containing protein n=1 Tax=Periophthalmus magnuspinnatus TaxID=409849 RepID=A0A3B4AP92_9GOBI